MNKPKQTTLFQSWGSKKEEKNCSNTNNSRNAGIRTKKSGVINLCDDDDEDALLAQALDESLLYAGYLPSTSKHQNGGDQSNVGNISIGMDSEEPQYSVTVPGFDRVSGKLWIYPTNYPVRDYQYKIVQQSLFKNTMVTLPTGLGKTFIASVVMYNYYRWFPSGKIIFMAPTKPLVAQQIEACYNIMGIPQSDTAEMTGNMVPNERLKAWKEKRVFFLTPQVITNDLSRGSCPAESVKCVVVDEAHKALGNHAYCQVVRELVKYTTNFRILALSATPGSDIKAVQQVLTNLMISHIEIRTEECPDIKPYTHERVVDKIVVPLGEELTKVKTKYIEVMDSVIKRLNRQKVVYNRPTTSFSKFLLLKSREEFRQNPPESLSPNHYGIVEGDFALSISLFHGFELLQLHGLRSLYNYLDNILHGDKGYGRTKNELQRNAEFNDVMTMLSEKFSKYDNSSLSQKPAFVAGHPKMEKLLEVAIKHFEKFQDSGGTRIMIFSQYRDSVVEITNMLNQHQPLIKAMSFIGQSSAGKVAKGFTQKEQLRVMKEFREGGYNTLVSTCVGEEGLDIGDVDLIICFDAHKSPIRLVQRMGRTGRKRKGRIVMLVTEGKEEQIYNQSQYSKKSIHRAILNGSKSLQFYQHNPRMIPSGLTPTCHKMHISVNNKYKVASKKNKSEATMKTVTKVKKGAKVKEEETDITLEEYKELQQYFTDDLANIKLPVLSYGSLYLDKEEHKKVLDDNGKHQYLSLSEWLPWQNRLQETSSVEHSNRSKHLVELVQFSELQETLGPEDDNYGMEMRMFLNEDDVLKTDKAASATESMRNYCASKVPEKSKSEAQVKRPKKRTLPILEPLEESENSEDKLPEFDLGDNSLCIKPSPSKTGDIVNSKCEKPNDKISTSTKKRKKHTAEISVIEHVSDNDDDFEDIVIPNKNNNNDKNNIICEDKIEMETDSLNDDKIDDDLKPINFENENENSDVQLPPRRPCLIRTPPPLEEVDAVFIELAKKSVLSPVDLVQLVEEWHAEEDERRSQEGQTHTKYFTDQKPLVPKMSVCAKPLRIKNDFISRNVFSVEQEEDCEIVSKNENIICTGEMKTENEKQIIKDCDSILVTIDSEFDKFGQKTETNVIIIDSQSCPMESSDLIDNQLVTETSNDKDSCNVLRMEEENLEMTEKPSPHDQLNVDLFNDSMFAKDLSLPSFQKLKPSSNSSQLNFTQALSFLDKSDSSLPVTTPLKSCVKINLLPVVSERDEENLNVSSSSPIHNNRSSQSVSKQESSPAKTEDVCFSKSDGNASKMADHSSKYSEKEKSLNISNQEVFMNESLEDMFDDDFDVPQFDLGFDLEEGEDFVPPTPKPEQPTIKVTQPDLSNSKCKLKLQFPNENDRSPIEPSFPSKTPLHHETLNVFEKIKQKNSPANQSSCLFGGNRNNLWSDRSAMKCSTPLKDLPVNVSRVKNSCQETPETDSLFDSSFSLLQSSSAQKPKMSLKKNVGRNIRSKNEDNSKQECTHDNDSEDNILKEKLSIQTKDEDNIFKKNLSIQTKDEKSEIKSVLKEIMSASQNSMSSNDLFAGEDDMEDFISDQFEILDNIEKNNMCVDPVINDDHLEDESVRKEINLNQSLISHLNKRNVFSRAPVTTKKETSALQSDEEDEVQIKRRVKSSKAIITSPHEKDKVQFKTPTKPIGRQKVKKACPLNISSEEENEIGKILGDDDRMEESDEDFAVETIKTRVKNTKSNDKKKKKKRVKCAFIEEEAELSGEHDSSDDSTGSDLGQLSGNFINDETQYSSQAHLHDSVDNQAMYLRSVHSPLQHHGKFRLQYNHKYHDVFSQVPHADEEPSQYMEDSFCVDNDYEDSFICSEDEDSLLEVKRKGKSKKKKGKSLNNVKGKKRLCKLSESSSEDDMKPVIPLTQHPTSFSNSPVVCKKKTKRAFFSSSEDEDATTSRLVTNSNCKNLSTDQTSLLSKKNSINSFKNAQSISKSENKTTEAPYSAATIDTNSVQIPNFELDLDFFDDDIMDVPNDSEIINVPNDHQTQEKSVKTGIVLKTSTSKSDQIDNMISSEEQLRKERIQKQKEQQEKFKACLVRNSSTFDVPEEDGTVLPASTSAVDNDIMQEILLEQSSKKSSRLTLIVDSREISGAQDIISNLRFKHDINVEVRQLKACDYLLSTRLAVDRQLWSEFSNGSNHSKFVERIQRMRGLYDRCCLIVETDKSKPGTEKNTKKMHRSKYVDQTIATLAQSDIRLLFTDSQKGTVELLVELCQLESKKGLGISVPLNLNKNQEQMLKFYLSIPKVTYIQAVNFIHNFKSVSQFLNSSAKVIEIKGKLTSQRAGEIYSFINHKFDLQMVPSCR